MTGRPLRKILLIEDEADIRMVAKLALESVGGFSVETCGSGREALASAEAVAPDLIMLDVMMPGMDGPATLAALRALPSLGTTPVVFMTAKVQPEEVAYCRALGAIDVVAKPFDPMALAQTVETIWEKHIQ